MHRERGPVNLTYEWKAMIRIFSIVLLTGLVLAVPPAGAASPSGAASEDAAPAQDRPSVFNERNPRYRLQVSDELELKFRFTPEFDQSVKIQPDGFISLLDVGDVKVSGLSVEEVRDLIVERYQGILNEPVVSVTLKGFSDPFFIVGGEVGAPGRFDLRGELTVTDAIAIAGGLKPGAKGKEVVLFRRVSPEMVEVKKVDVRMVQRGQADEDVRLRPGDSIFVPRSTIGKIDRFLEVTRLGFYFPMGF